MYQLPDKRGMSPSPSRPMGFDTTDLLLLTVVFTGVIGSVVAWSGAAITAVLSGHPAPGFDPRAEVLALSRYAGNPSAAWGRPVGPTWLYWTSTGSVIVLLVTAVAAC